MWDGCVLTGNWNWWQSWRNTWHGEPVNIEYRDVTVVTGELSLNATIGRVRYEDLTGDNRDVMLSYVHYVN